jgi:hypothetical protein
MWPAGGLDPLGPPGGVGKVFNLAGSRTGMGLIRRFFFERESFQGRHEGARRRASVVQLGKRSLLRALPMSLSYEHTPPGFRATIYFQQRAHRIGGGSKLCGLPGRDRRRSFAGKKLKLNTESPPPPGVVKSLGSADRDRWARPYFSPQNWQNLFFDPCPHRARLRSRRFVFDFGPVFLTSEKTPRNSGWGGWS